MLNPPMMSLIAASVVGDDTLSFTLALTVYHYLNRSTSDELLKPGMTNVISDKIGLICQA